MIGDIRYYKGMGKIQVISNVSSMKTVLVRPLECFTVVDNKGSIIKHFWRGDDFVTSIRLCWKNPRKKKGSED